MAARSGLCIVDKPAGRTSHDVVAQVRRLSGTRRVGHAGTLDPMATGVLVLGIERATKLLGHLTLRDKSYEATIRLGQSTVTDDAEGELIAAGPADGLADGLGDPVIREAMSAFRGTFEQVPSSVSAVKVAGRRSYDRVRSGERVTLPPRRVSVGRLDVGAIRRDSAGLVDVDVSLDCSTGTYVRAIARDLGAALGVGGHLIALRRTRVGPFALASARTLDELAELPSPVFIDLADAVDQAFERRDVDAEQARVLSHGGRLEPAGRPGIYGVFGPDSSVIALVEERDGAARPVVVLSPAGSA